MSGTPISGHQDKRTHSFPITVPEEEDELLYTGIVL